MSEVRTSVALASFSFDSMFTHVSVAVLMHMVTGFLHMLEKVIG